MMRSASLILWLRWSWRDLRARWLQVTAIALIIALGTGVYAGLGSSTPWRKAANDASYAFLNLYDLRIKFTTGSYLPQTEVIKALNTIDHPHWINTVEGRLISPALIDASTADQSILVAGQIVGVDVAEDGPHLNRLFAHQGRTLNKRDQGLAVAVLEHHFADYYGLPAEGQITLGSGQSLDYVGTGLIPEYFMVFTEEGGMMAQSNYAVVFVSLETAQKLADREGMINDLVIKLSPDADRDQVQAEIRTALGQFRGVGYVVMTPETDKAYIMLHEDADNDDRFWKLIAYLFLAGATFGAFNLASRMVESQRREIGINMALGIPSRLIMIRPLLVAAQIAVLGVLFGVGIGILLSFGFGVIMRDFIALPVFETPFQGRIFLEAALLGVILPFAATLYPVWRAVRVTPIDAIRTTHHVSRSGRWIAALARIPLPGKSVTQMPLRNLLRAPRRTLLTLMGVAMAISLLVFTMGMLDTFSGALDRARTDFLNGNPDRMFVELNFFYPKESAPVKGVMDSSSVAAGEPGLRLGGYLMNGSESVETLLDLVQVNNSAVWSLPLRAPLTVSDQPGVIIAEKAAHDLGVRQGDNLTLRHPRREGLFSYAWVETSVQVVGIHTLPLRVLTYMDYAQAPLMGLEGMANMVQIIPTPDHTQTDVKRALFGQGGIASIQPVSDLINIFDGLIGMFIMFFYVIGAACTLLAFLIAYNSTSINTDERSRETATMLAFGIRQRTILRVGISENLLVGVLGTLIGTVTGILILLWFLEYSLDEMMAEFGISLAIRPSTVILAAVVGIGVVALTPIFSVRKIARTNIPAMLRVVE